MMYINTSKIKKDLCTPKNGYKKKFYLYIYIYIIIIQITYLEIIKN